MRWTLSVSDRYLKACWFDIKYPKFHARFEKKYFFEQTSYEISCQRRCRTFSSPDYGSERERDVCFSFFQFPTFVPSANDRKDFPVPCSILNVVFVLHDAKNSWLLLIASKIIKKKASVFTSLAVSGHFWRQRISSIRWSFMLAFPSFATLRCRHIGLFRYVQISKLEK